MTNQESTPLLQKKGEGSTYYFQKPEKTGSYFRSTTDEDGGQVVESLPQGSTEEDFAPKTLGVSSKVSGRIDVVQFGVPVRFYLPPMNQILLFLSPLVVNDIRIVPLSLSYAPYVSIHRRNRGNQANLLDFLRNCLGAKRRRLVL